MPSIEFISSILEFVDKYGVTIVILLFSIIALVKIIKWIEEKFNSLWKIVIEMKGALPVEETVENSLALNLQVKSILKEMVSSLDCNWAQLWQFHNGTHGLGRTRIPFMFLALTHEVCESDCEMHKEFERLPLSMFDVFVDRLCKEELIVYNYKEPGRSKVVDMVVGYGVHSGLVSAIRDVDGKIIGFVTVAWKENKEFTYDEKTKFRVFVQRMAVIMSSGERKSDEEKD